MFRFIGLSHSPHEARRNGAQKWGALGRGEGAASIEGKSIEN